MTKKILFLTKNIDNKTGWGRYSWGIINEFINYSDWQVTVAVESLNNRTNELLILSKDRSILSFLRTILILRRLVKKYDIIHCLDGYPYAIFVYLAVLGTNKKYFINGVGTFTIAPLKQRFKGWLLKRAYQNAEKIFCISHYTAKRLRLLLPKLNNFIVVNPGLDSSLFGNIKSKSAPIQPKLISVGAIKGRKGQIYSIEAVRILKKKYPGVTLTLVGNFDEENYVRQINQLVKLYHIENAVIFLQDLSDYDLQKEYAKANIFIMPSINDGDNFEGFGLVYLEAGANGLPSIGCWESGAEDAISDGLSGYLVEQGSSQAIVAAVMKILNNYEFLSSGAIHFARNFNWSKTAEKYKKYYDRI